VDHHLAVSTRLENRAGRLVRTPELVRIDQVSVVRNNPQAVTAFRNEGLDILDPGGSGRRVTHVPYSMAAGQAIKAALDEDFTDKPHALVRPDMGTVTYNNARAFLATMLKGKEAAVYQGGAILHTENTEKPAMFSRRIAHVYSPFTFSQS
jgi:hypothetical protein